MIEPWFDPNHYAWIPGTAYGLAAGLMAGLVGWLVPRGRARNFILRAWFTLWAVAVALLIVGIVALANGQPWGIWYGLLLPGAIGTLVVGANSVVILKRYREVEERRWRQRTYCSFEQSRRSHLARAQRKAGPAPTASATQAANSENFSAKSIDWAVGKIPDV